MSRRLAVSVVALAAVLSAGTASAAKPERLPFTYEPFALDAQQGCAFPIELGPEPGSRYAQTAFGDGRLVTTGSGADRATNLDTLASVSFRTSGKATFTTLPNGDQRLQLSGRSMFYFFPGDQGPFGEVGPNGALYYLVGHVDETLDPETGFTVTSFEWGGQATEVCGLID